MANLFWSHSKFEIQLVPFVLWSGGYIVADVSEIALGQNGNLLEWAYN
jgi:hypothetical protein